MFDALDATGCTYAFVDIRGYGNSREVSGQFTIGEVAADAIALADQLGWHEFHVVGLDGAEELTAARRTSSEPALPGKITNPSLRERRGDGLCPPDRFDVFSNQFETG